VTCAAKGYTTGPDGRPIDVVIVGLKSALETYTAMLEAL
jgi:hypothetical protein